ncbi:cellulose binding domain-containing protein [Herbidospora mongoliensis]|uniref:cellulose binding domain-containing protein n=1 Tax=Herbidospora mongoliensis TaxID=688067 RepID=UPI00082CFB9F|nr:cellulose binding domain-containing protein [Herbidospora mongoliensis]
MQITAVLLAASLLAAPALAPAPTSTPSPSPTGSTGPLTCRTGPVPSVPPGNAAPTAPGAPVASSPDFAGAYLRWTPSVDDEGVVCYEVYMDVGADGIIRAVFQGVPAPAEGRVYLPTPVGTKIYGVYVVAVDRYGVRSARSPVTQVSISNDIIQLPPARPTAVVLSPTSARLTWTAPSGPTITAYQVISSGQLLTTVPGTTATLTGLTPGTEYSVTVRPVYYDGSWGYPSSPAIFTAGASSASCEVTYSSHAWGTGMTANVALKNIGAEPIEDWELTFTFPAIGQQVTQGWSADWAQSGQRVTVTGMSWNRDIAPGRTLWIGFNGTHTGANPAPGDFAVNGSACA